jgi:ribosomal protein S18 acetylase RimI-like enzyme
MEFRRGAEHELGAIEAVLMRTKAELDTRGIHQWTAEYPNRAFLAEALADGSLHVLDANGTIVGLVVLDERQSSEWEAIPWQTAGGRALVIHALMVDPAAQGQGFGAALVASCERWATEQGYQSIRLDAFTGNPAALRLYEQRGYTYRSDVWFGHKPVGSERYACYEKPLGG